jgi:excisionase family DNA binding protein
MPKLDEYLKIAEAARYLGVHYNTLRNWEAAGKIKVHRHPMNRYRLYRVSDLDKVLRDTERSSEKGRRKPR